MRLVFVVLTLLVMAQAASQENVPGLVVKAIQKDVYLHKSYKHVNGFGLVSANGLVVVEDGKAFIVDTPWSGADTEKLVTWIKEKGLELLGSVSTHSHEDRAGGIAWLNAHSVPTHASRLTNQILESEGRETAEFSFEGAEKSLAHGLIEVFYPGSGHAVDNVVVWLPKSSVLFGGCFVRSEKSRGLGYTGEADIKEWSVSVDKVLLKYADAKRVIPGHGQMGDVQLLRHTKSLIELALVGDDESKTNPARSE